MARASTSLSVRTENFQHVVAVTVLMAESDVFVLGLVHIWHYHASMGDQITYPFTPGIMNVSPETTRN